MTTQEKNRAIAEWLGYKIHIRTHPNYPKTKIFELEDENGQWIEFWQPDKDRNQQKLIEDKLIKMKYFIQYTFDDFKKEWEIFLDSDEILKNIVSQNKSKEIAFIDAVIKLIL